SPDPPTTDTHTLSLHDALPIFISASAGTRMSLVRLLTTGAGSPRNAAINDNSSPPWRVVAAKKSSGCVPTVKVIGNRSPRATQAGKMRLRSEGAVTLVPVSYRLRKLRRRHPTFLRPVAGSIV